MIWNDSMLFLCVFTLGAIWGEWVGWVGSFLCHADQQRKSLTLDADELISRFPYLHKGRVAIWSATAGCWMWMNKEKGKIRALCVIKGAAKSSLKGSFFLSPPPPYSVKTWGVVRSIIHSACWQGAEQILGPGQWGLIVLVRTACCCWPVLLTGILSSDLISISWHV